MVAPHAEKLSQRRKEASLVVSIAKRLDVELPIIEFYNATAVKEQAALVDGLKAR